MELIGFQSLNEVPEIQSLQQPPFLGHPTKQHRSKSRRERQHHPQDGGGEHSATETEEGRRQRPKEAKEKRATPQKRKGGKLHHPTQEGRNTAPPLKRRDESRH